MKVREKVQVEQEPKQQKKNRFKIDKLEQRIAPSAHCGVMLGLLESGVIPEPAQEGFVGGWLRAGCGGE